MTLENLPTTGFCTRLLRGGVVLSPFERFLLTIMEEHVPAEMIEALRGQWRGLNLIQRSPDWRELRFYRLIWGRVDRRALPKLSVRDGEVKLLSVALSPAGATKIVNINFWAVNGWFFSLNADRPWRPFQELSGAAIASVEHSYRSNLVRRGA
jgi:hypothetical protein